MPSGDKPEKGRHRHATGTWTPQVRYPHASAHAAPDPALVTAPLVIPPPALAETTVPGLRKFDLGSVPAPVTPPRSWRGAAWFAVGASLAVVFGLVFAASALVGRPKNTDTIDALPGYPSLPAFFESSAESARPPAPPRSTATSRDQQPTTVIPTTSARRQSSSGPRVTVPPVPTIPGTSAQDTTTAPAPPPVRRTTPGRAFAMNDPAEIGDRTETFYRTVTTDPSAAFQMTTGEMRLQGEQAFRRRYADIRSVRVRQIDIDPNQGTTVSEVQVTRQDGSTFTERRRLFFTAGPDPRISSEVTH